jgi:NAD(P)-dependent dehydrogenase (short-subunit alcohol dehydrogenase family)/pimeloyl-ACP methyl ester carboxylesterase
MSATPRLVPSTDGVRLAVYESGNPDGPTIVAIHGYPDNHTVWDGVAELLASDYRVITYDVRGAGESDKPGARSAYRMHQLVDDFAAVLDAVSPDAPVHVLAHDWGSIQAWPAVTDPDLAGRVLSFTSISGPSLDHAAGWLRRSYRHPRAALRQLTHSYYIGLFQLPGLPEAAARSGVIDRATRSGGRRWRSALAAAGGPARTPADSVNGISLYRANMLGTAAAPAPRPATVPVQLIVPAHDAYVTPDMVVAVTRPWAADLTVNRVAGGHWVVSERPDVIARLTREFLAGRAAAPASAPTPHGEFGGRLVVVTGGARGIGRATALEFARRGANVVVADVNDVAAKETVGELHELGVQAAAMHLDVSDPAAWEQFAARVRDRHGVPDVVVNNAGIGMGGPFLATSVQDWERILGVNLWGVIHGCRLFGRQMAERGTGGHIVNISSSAAFAPSVLLPAYATTKAAVLMLSECLRAELEREDIGVTAVCPGVIDTDITRTTVHVGVDEETSERMRALSVAAFERRGYGPEKAATRIVDAVRANRPIAVITPEAKAMRAISRFAPPLSRRLAKFDLSRLQTDRMLERG